MRAFGSGAPRAGGWVEGYKAYILPAVAAVLVIGYFVWRGVAPDPGPADAGETETTTAPEKPRKQQIDEAVAAAGPTAPPLPDAYREAVSAAMAPIVQRCRKPRPDDAAVTVSLQTTVKAADQKGGYIDTIEFERGGGGDAASEGFLACIREGSHGLQLPATDATGKGSYRFELAP